MFEGTYLGGILQPPRWGERADEVACGLPERLPGAHPEHRRAVSGHARGRRPSRSTAYAYDERRRRKSGTIRWPGPRSRAIERRPWEAVKPAPCAGNYVGVHLNNKFYLI